MDSNTIITLISNFIILSSIGFVYYFQKERIKNLERNIEGQKDIFNSLKTYHNIFDIAKVEDYVKMLIDTEKQKFAQVSESQQTTIESISKHNEKLYTNLQSSLKLNGKLLPYIKPDVRKEFINELDKDSMVYELATKVDEKYKEEYINGFHNYREAIKAIFDSDHSHETKTKKD